MFTVRAFLWDVLVRNWATLSIFFRDTFTIGRITQLQWSDPKWYGSIYFINPTGNDHTIKTQQGTTEPFIHFMGHIAHHDDVIKWKYFPRHWPFVRGIHRSPVNSPHKGQWRGALMFTLICARINDWVNNRKAGDLRRYPAHYDVIVM